MELCNRACAYHDDKKAAADTGCEDCNSQGQHSKAFELTTKFHTFIYTLQTMHLTLGIPSHLDLFSSDRSVKAVPKCIIQDTIVMS